MKATYRKPAMTVVNINAHECLLSGSINGLRTDSETYADQESEVMVKGNTYSGNAIEWDGWE